MKRLDRWISWLAMGWMMLGGAGWARGQAVELMPNAVPICAEGCTITVIPAGTVYQLGIGAGKSYTPMRKAKGEGGTLLVSYESFSFDPAPNKVKTFFVQQKAEPFPVTYLPENSKAPVTVTVSALGTAPAAVPANSPGAAPAAAAPAANESARQVPAKAPPPPVKNGPPPPPPPSPTTVQVIQYTCAAPVAGTVIPPGLPNGVAVVCVYGLANLPLTTPAATTPVN